MDFWVCSRTPNTYSIPLLSGLPEKPIWELEMVVVKRREEVSGGPGVVLAGDCKL